MVERVLVKQAADITAVVPTQELVSMQRGYEAATLIAGVASEKGTVLIGTTVSVASDGTMMSSWTASEAPGVNFDPNVVGIRIGSPGREPVSYPTTPTPEPDPTPVAEADDIAITEIMVDTSDGRLPQWIELTNVSGEEKSLAGWSLIVMNTAADDAAVGSRVTIDLSGTLGVGGGTDAGGTLGKSLLLVAWDGRNSRNLEGNDRVVDVSDQVDETGRYTLISETAFMLALMPPQKTSVVAYGDTAGNLGAAEAWEIPSSDGARSSLIRREMHLLMAWRRWALPPTVGSWHPIPRLSQDLRRGMAAMKMLAPRVMMVEVHYPLNFHISVLPAIKRRVPW